MIYFFFLSPDFVQNLEDLIVVLQLEDLILVLYLLEDLILSRVCTRCQGIQGKTRPLPPQANPLPCQVSPVKSPALFYTFFNGSISLDDLYLTPLACKTINLTA